jgi:hypothetical protein
VASLALEHRMLAPGRDPRRNQAIAWSIGPLELGRLFDECQLGAVRAGDVITRSDRGQGA